MLVSYSWLTEAAQGYILGGVVEVAKDALLLRDYFERARGLLDAVGARCLGSWTRGLLNRWLLRSRASETRWL